MSAPGPRRGVRSAASRCCPGCGTVLAADNTTRLCSRCHREHRDLLRTPPRLGDEFYDTGEFRAAFESELIGKVFKAYRYHPRWLRLFGKALNQETFGLWLGLSQAQVSKLEAGKPEHNLAAHRHYALTLHLPRHMLWFKLPGQSRPAGAIRSGRAPEPDTHRVEPVSSLHVLAGPSAKEVISSRREFVQWGRAAVATRSLRVCGQSQVECAPRWTVVP